MSDRLHEIMGQIGVLHNQLLENKKIEDSKEVLEFIKNYDIDIQKHYLNLLLQYYFQQNDLKNLKELLLVGAKFDIRFEDVKEGSIYPLLVRLEKKGMISSELRPSPLGPKRKYYSLTAEGEAYLQEFIKCWTEVQSSVNRILKKEE